MPGGRLPCFASCEGDPAQGEADRQPWQFCDTAKIVDDGGHDVGYDRVVDYIEEDADECCDHDQEPLFF